MVGRLDNMSIRLKVFLVGGIMAFVAVLTCVVALNRLDAVDGEMENVNDQNISRLSLLALMLGQENRAAGAVTPLFIPSLPETTKKEFREKVKEALTEMKKYVDTYEEKARGSGAETTFKTFNESFRIYYNSTRHFLLSEPPIEGEPIVENEADVSAVIEEMGTKFDELTATEQRLALEADGRASDAHESAVRVLLVILIASFALALPLGLRIANGIVGPIRQISGALKALGRGDLRSTIDIRSTDEIGAMAKDLVLAQDSLRESLKEMLASSVTLGQNATDLSAVSQQVADNANETSTQSEEAARAAEEVSGHVQTVAAATEEVSASIREISQSSSDAVRVAASAVTEAESATGTVAKLGDSSAEIGSVVKAITSIAEQTNLLALNATIEAARAGDAGKGFAVVANEVKDLAQETARATEDITVRIESIQTDAHAAVDVIARVTEIIEEINSYQTTIASAVEQQSATTSQMAENVSGAAGGSASIAVGIEQVAVAAKASSNGIRRAQDAAVELASLSDQLRTTVNRFQF
jgi:methyl-accepting chemotaxis protein